MCFILYNYCVCANLTCNKIMCIHLKKKYLNSPFACFDIDSPVEISQTPVPLGVTKKLFVLPCSVNPSPMLIHGIPCKMLCHLFYVIHIHIWYSYVLLYAKSLTFSSVETLSWRGYTVFLKVDFKILGMFLWQQPIKLKQKPITGLPKYKYCRQINF